MCVRLVDHGGGPTETPGLPSKGRKHHGRDGRERYL